MNNQFDTKEHRLEALLKNLELNTQGDPQKSLSYDKAMEYFDKFSNINFKDCIVMYTSSDDVWDVWLWANKKIQFTFIWNEDAEFSMSIYYDNDFILCQEYDDMDEILGKWSRIIDKLDKQPKSVDNVEINHFWLKIKETFARWKKNFTPQQ